MKTRFRTLITALTATAALAAGSASAATVLSQLFTGATLSVDNSTALSWGIVTDGIFQSGGATHYTNVDFGSVTDGSNGITTVGGSAPSIGVTLSELSPIGTKNIGSVVYNFSTGGATNGAYGDFGSSEDNVWELNFTDLGVGTRTITIYMGHSNGGRVFQMDYNLDGAGYVDGTVGNGGVSAGIGTLGGEASHSFRYDITVNDSLATTDLSLRFGSISGGSGEAYLGGYTVTGTVIPEPGSLALLGLGGLCMMKRRRRV